MTTNAVRQQRVTPAAQLGAYRLRRDGKTIYQFGMKWSALSDFMPASPQATPSKAQRPYRSSHAATIKRYFINAAARKGRLGWVSGPLVLAIAPRYVEFEPAGEIEDDTVPVFGLLTLPQGTRDRLTILDGQHRRAAMQMIGTEAASGNSKAVVAEQSLRDAHISVELYETDDIKEMRQMFADFSKQRGIDTPTRVWFDGRDLFHSAAQELIERRAVWLQDFIPLPDPTLAEIPPASIGAGTPWWMTLANLSATIKRRATGGRARARDLAKLEQDHLLVDVAKQFFEDELPVLHAAFDEIKLGTIDRFSIVDRRRRSAAYRAGMPQALAWLVHEWVDEEEQPLQVLADFVAGSAMDPSDPDCPWVDEDGRVRRYSSALRGIIDELPR